MTVFTRNTPTFRIAATERGDTMQSVAGRELGDSNRWPELVWLNNLTHPYLTDDPARVGPGVLLTGSFLKVPAPTGVYTDSADTGQVFERDCVLVNKRLDVNESGDLAIISGSANLGQQLRHRLVTPRGQATRHPLYGSLLYRLIGRMNNRAGSLMAAQYARSAVLSDYRIRSVDQVEAVVQGDQIKVEARATTIAGGAVDLITEQGQP